MHIARNMVRKAIEDNMTEPEVDRVMVSIFGNLDSLPIDALLNRMANDRLTILKYEDLRPSRDEAERRF